MAKKTITEERAGQLEELGYSFIEANNSWQLEDSIFVTTDLEKFPKEEWENIIDKITGPGDNTPTKELTKAETALLTVDTEADLKKMQEWRDKIVKFKAKYGGKKLVIRGADDKKGHDRNMDAAREMRELRQEIVAYEKEKTAPLKSTIKWFSENFGTLLDIFEPLEKFAKEQRDTYKKAVEDKKNEEKNRLEALAKERAAMLIDAGMTFDVGSGYYVVGNEEFEVATTSLGLVDIQSMTEPVWQEQLSIIKNKVDTIAAKQKIKDDAAETARLEKIKEDAKLQQEVNEARAEKLGIRSELLQGLGATETETSFTFKNISVTKERLGEMNAGEWDTIKTEFKTAITTAKEEEKKQQTITARKKELADLGFVWDQLRQHYQNNGVEIHIKFLNESDEDTWLQNLDAAKSDIKKATQLAKQKEDRHKILIDLGYTCTVPYAAYQYKTSSFAMQQSMIAEQWKWEEDLAWAKAQIQEIDNNIALQTTRLAEITPFLLFGHSVDTKELYKLEQGAYDKLLADTKEAHADQKRKDLEAEQERQQKEQNEKLAKATDAEKWQHFINSLPAVTEMVSEDYKKAAETATQLLEKIKAIAIK